MKSELDESPVVVSAYKVKFVCEKCGAKNAEQFNYVYRYEKTSWVNHPLSPFREEREQQIRERNEAAVTNAKIAAEKRRGRIDREQQKHCYRTLKPTCRCKKCRSVPVWAYDTNGNSVYEWLLIISGLLSLFGGLFFILGALDGEIVPGGLYPLPVFLCIILLGRVLNLIKYMRTKKLAPQYIPEITFMAERVFSGH